MPSERYGYGLRSLVESQISRIKRSIGATLLTQQSEGLIIIADIINLWNSFSSSIPIKNA